MKFDAVDLALLDWLIEKAIESVTLALCSRDDRADGRGDQLRHRLHGRQAMRISVVNSRTHAHVAAAVRSVLTART